MKKLLTILLVVLLAFAATACASDSQSGNTAETAAADAPTVSGGWTLYDNTEAAKLPDAVQAAFDKATEGLTGVTYLPIALIGEQVVAGTNYAILCQATTVTAAPETSLKVLIIYADLQGNAELSKVSDFNITDYTQGEGTTTGKSMGGWSVPEDVTEMPLPDEAQAAYDKAIKSYLGDEPKPAALLGTQIVAGTNYAILCHTPNISETFPSQLCVLTIYADLKDNCEITNVCMVSPDEFNS